MSYEPRFTKLFLRLTKKIDSHIRERLYETLDKIIYDPHKGMLFLYKNKKYRKFRFGDYRIIYDIDEKEGRVVFLLVDHRKRVYRRRELGK